MAKSKGLRLKAIRRFLCRSSKDPERMARGVGIGLFIGFLPAIGFQFVLALTIARILGANGLAAAIGTLVTNPLTAVPVSAFSFWLGDFLLPGERLAELATATFSVQTLLDSPGRVGTAFLTGCLVLSIIGGLLGYVGMRFYYSRK